MKAKTAIGLGGIAAISIATIYAAKSMNLAPSADRVSGARKNQDANLRKMFAEKGLKYPPKQVHFRAFKEERELEVWARNDASSKFVLVQIYPIVAMSGQLGPKRKEGDLQAPEGLYIIDRFNPVSAYHLSLGLDYPNKSDRIRSDKEQPGSDIFIHGNSVSIGCLAMTDAKIEQIYLMALDARSQGQSRIRVDIFPYRMQNLREAPKTAGTLWTELKAFYDFFEKNAMPARFNVESTGRYRLVEKG